MSDTVKAADFKTYMEESKSWETDRVKQQQASNKLAWRLAAVGCLVGVLGVGSTVIMAMKEPPPPTVVRVNDTTGQVDLLSTIRDHKTSYEEVVNKYFVQWYARFRESYSKNLAEDYYYRVGLMSSNQEQQRYFSEFNPKNPQSPLNVYGDYATVKTNVSGTSFIKPDVALVRFSKEVTRGSELPEITYWVATVTFRYSALPMKEKDRAINPLGFQVVEYRVDPDTLVPGRRVSPSSNSISQPSSKTTLFPQETQPATAIPPTTESQQ